MKARKFIDVNLPVRFEDKGLEHRRPIYLGVLKSGCPANDVLLFKYWFMGCDMLLKTNHAGVCSSNPNLSIVNDIQEAFKGNDIPDPHKFDNVIMSCVGKRAVTIGIDKSQDKEAEIKPKDKEFSWDKPFKIISNNYEFLSLYSNEGLSRGEYPLSAKIKCKNTGLIHEVAYTINGKCRTGGSDAELDLINYEEEVNQEVKPEFSWNRPIRVKSGAATFIGARGSDETISYPFLVDLKYPDGRITTYHYARNGKYWADGEDHELDLENYESKPELHWGKKMMTRDGSFIAVEWSIGGEQYFWKGVTYDAKVTLVPRVAKPGKITLFYNKDGKFNHEIGNHPLDLINC